MGRNNHIYNSFVAGEISPNFLGRADTKQYSQGLINSKNAIVFPQGGAARRTGTQYKFPIVNYDQGSAPSWTSGTTTPTGARAFPFTRSGGDRWQIILTTSLPDSDVGNNWRGFLTNDGANAKVLFGGVGNALTSANTLFFDYYSFSQAELDDIQFKQTGDIIYFVHPDYRPFYMIFNTTTRVFDMYVFGLGVEPNFGRASVYDFPVSLIPSADGGIEITDLTGGFWSIEWSATGSDAAETRFGTLSPGDIVKLSNASTTGYFLILEEGTSAGIWDGFFLNSSGPFADGMVFGNEDNNDSSIEFPQWGASRWPYTVDFFESRLFFGGNDRYPDKLWFSQIDDIYEFDIAGLQQDAGFADVPIASDQFEHVLKATTLSKIQWVASGKNITVGTEANEFILEGPDTTITLGPTNAASRIESSYGSRYLQATRIENAILFMQRHGGSLRELVFDFNEDSYKAQDLNIIAEHMPYRSIEDIEKEGGTPSYVSGFKNIVVQNVPVPIIWCIDENGRLSGCTRERIQQVNAWHHHQVAGDVNSDQEAKFLSINVMASTLTSDSRTDNLWAVVRRRVGSDNAGTTEYNTRLFLEVLSSPFRGSKVEAGWTLTAQLGSRPNRIDRAPVYMDCAFGAISTDYTDGVIDDLPHGVGAQVSVICNGFWFGNYTVDASGEIDISNQLTSPSEAFKAIIGFNYDADIVPVPPEVRAQLGTSLNLMRRADQVLLHFTNSLGCKFGRVDSETQEDYTPYYSLEEITFATGNSTVVPQLFSGVKVIETPPNYERRQKLLIRSHLPFPFTLTHLTARMNVYE